MVKPSTLLIVFASNLRTIDARFVQKPGAVNPNRLVWVDPLNRMGSISEPVCPKGNVAGVTYAFRQPNLDPSEGNPNPPPHQNLNRNTITVSQSPMKSVWILTLFRFVIHCSIPRRNGRICLKQ